MSSLNASSVAKCQQWRNDLVNSSDLLPLNAHELFNEPVQQKYLAQRGLLGLLGQQGQQHGQAGQHGPQHGQAGQHGHHSQMGQLGQRAQLGQHGQTSQDAGPGLSLQGNLGQQGLPGQQGFSGQQSQQSLSGQNGLSGPNGFSSQNGLSGRNGFSGKNGISGQQGLLCQNGQPLIVSQPGQPAVQAQPGQPGQILALSPTICCDKANCERATIEQLPEQYFQEPATPFTLMNPADGCDPQAGKKDPSEQYMYCPCCMSRGQLVTICCTGKDCDNSTKIDEVAMGPPEEKRAKTTFNQNQYKY